jgi:hypothetical protein
MDYGPYISTSGHQQYQIIDLVLCTCEVAEVVLAELLSVREKGNYRVLVYTCDLLEE